MYVNTQTEIVTHKILNEETGEYESKDFKQIKETKVIKGGFRMTYKSYDEAQLEIVKSTMDLKILLHIRDMFTYQKVEVVVSPTEISKELEVAKSKVQTVIKRMTDSGLIKKVSRGTYRLNPFMFIPFRASGEELQYEWKQLK